MNENIDLSKILKGCPVGTEFYHVVYGKVWFDDILNGDSDEYCFITFSLCDESHTVISVTKKGTFSMRYDGECLIFPSKEQRDWSKFERFWDKPKKVEMNIEDIKSGILNRIKSTQKYSRITKEKIMEWINEIPTIDFNPHTITEDKEEANEKFLYNRKVSEIIDYLSKYKDCILEERYFGYEFCIYRPETSDEIIERICNIVDVSCRVFLEQNDEIANIDEQIHKLENRKKQILLQK